MKNYKILAYINTDMHYYYISGTSRGIGKAIAEELLLNNDNYVIGFSRSNTIRHERFEFIEIDLLRPEEVKNFRFINIIDAQSICLINNSGTIGHIEHVGLLDNQSIIDAFFVNAIAPSILSNNFVKAYQGYSCKKLVINVSSGAARHAIESWSAYCASKSALDMFSSVAQLEQDIEQNQFPVKFLSIAPGIVDTKMQDEIREVSEKSFGDVNRFIRYKSENKLIKPEIVAQMLIKVIEQADGFKNPIIDLREIDFS